MRIGLNLLHALPEIGGGWNYIRNLVSALAEIDRSNQFFAFVSRESEKLVPARPNFESLQIPIDSRDRPRRVLFEHASLPRLARRLDLDCLHWFSGTQALLNSVPAAVTVYDLQSFLDLAPYSRIKRVYLKAMVSQTVRRARILLPMSRATENDLRRIFKVRHSRLAVVPPVLAPEFRPARQEDIFSFRSEHGLPEKFWLYVSHFYPHKNHLRLLEAYLILKSRYPSAWPLVLRGDDKSAVSSVRQFVKDRGLETEVRFLPPLEDFQLPFLFSASAALIFPSLYEGGGLPVVEAMACGLPVAAAGIPPLKEFAGAAALYFDPYDTSSMAEAMIKLETEPGLQEASRSLGLARAEEFRPAKVIPGLQAAYVRAAT